MAWTLLVQPRGHLQINGTSPCTSGGMGPETAGVGRLNLPHEPQVGHRENRSRWNSREAMTYCMVTSGSVAQHADDLVARDFEQVAAAECLHQPLRLVDQRTQVGGLDLPALGHLPDHELRVGMDQ